MGLFSNILGNANNDVNRALNRVKRAAEDAVVDAAAQEVRKEVMNSFQQNHPDVYAAAQNAQAAERTNTGSYQNCTGGSSGDSWGCDMPSEENQYNSGLSYQDYFANVFSGAFPAYQISRESIRNGRATLFVFSQAGAKKLVVELLPESSCPYKIKNECRAQGVAYIRFYYNHRGWWNTKSYVIRRTSQALGM